MRQFIRHPADIPIECKPGDVDTQTTENLKDIGHGGLCYSSTTRILPGTGIHIRIPFCNPEFEVDGVVAWCHRVNGQFEAGVSFGDAETEYQVRMVEQVCHIEHYRREVLEKEGRTLSAEEAAAEWVTKNAASFPR